MKRTTLKQLIVRAEKLGYGIATHTKDNYGKSWCYCRYGLLGGVVLYCHNFQELKECIEFSEEMRRG